MYIMFLVRGSIGGDFAILIYTYLQGWEIKFYILLPKYIFNAGKIHLSDKFLLLQIWTIIGKVFLYEVGGLYYVA